MKMKLVAFAITALFSSASFAADGDWTSYYFGMNVGSANGNSDSVATLGGSWSVETQTLQDFVSDNSGASLDPSGTGYGLQFGYDHEFDNSFVLGVEFDYSMLNLDETRQTAQLSYPPSPALTYAFSNSVDADHAYSLRPKFGYAFDNTLIYVTAGWSWTSIDFGSDLLSSGNYSKVGSSSKTFSSNVWGAGVEHKFSDSWSMRLEYLKVSGGDTTYTTTFRNANFPTYSETFNVDFDYDIVRVGVNYRF